MGFAHTELTILDFDNTCTAQALLLARFPHRIVDLAALPQSNLYCAEATFRRIEALLPPDAHRGITLLGNGNHHYAALALIARHTEPFTLVLLDHHTDSAAGDAADPLTCGSWVRHALHNVATLAHVVLVGPPETSLAEIPAELRPRITHFPDAATIEPASLLGAIPTGAVHLSIDKDALAPTDARTNWDQGDLTLDQLLPLVSALRRGKNLRGADLCGEWPTSPLDQFQPEARAALALNEQANLRLVEALLATD